MNRLVSGVRILMVGLPLKGYLPISTSKMLRTGRVLYTSDDVAKAVRLRSFNDKTATSERWGWPGGGASDYFARCSGGWSSGCLK